MKRIKLKDLFDWPSYTIRVTRPSKWGNPYPLSKYSLEESLRLFRKHLEDNPELVVQAREKFKDYKYIGCSCNLDEPCHADIWLEFLNKNTN